MPNLGSIIASINRSKIKHQSNKNFNTNNVPSVNPGNNDKCRIINLGKSKSNNVNPCRPLVVTDPDNSPQKQKKKKQANKIR